MYRTLQFEGLNPGTSIYGRSVEGAGAGAGAVKSTDPNDFSSDQFGRYRIDLNIGIFRRKALLSLLTAADRCHEIRARRCVVIDRGHLVGIDLEDHLSISAMTHCSEYSPLRRIATHDLSFCGMPFCALPIPACLVAAHRHVVKPPGKLVLYYLIPPHNIPQLCREAATAPTMGQCVSIRSIGISLPPLSHLVRHNR